MKALWRYNTGTQAYVDMPEPQVIQPDDVKIRITYNTIGILDMRMSREWDFYAKPGIAGYEAAGIIVDLGEEAKAQGLYVGQRVTGSIVSFCGHCHYCQLGQEHLCMELHLHPGTLCEYVVWSSSQVIPIPSWLPDSIGTLMEPVAVVYMAAMKLDIDPGDSLCIFGGDFNGLVLLQMAKQLGAREVTVVEPKSFNRQLALHMGADHVIDPMDETYTTDLMTYTDFIGYERVAITSSTSDWIDAAVNVTAAGGRLVLNVYYDYQKDIQVNTIKLYKMGITITSSLLYTKAILHDVPAYIRSLELAPLIAETYSFNQALKAFEVEKNHLYPRIGIDMS